MALFRARDPVSGYSHLAGLALACAGAVALLWRAHAREVFVPNLAYAISLVALDAASSAYHLVPGAEALTRRLRKLDHSAIFVFIAGTSTPVFFRAFDGSMRVAMLGAAWGLAILGVVLRLVWMQAPRALYTLMYVATGLLVAVEARATFHNLPVLPLALVVGGGVVYILGAVIYATKRPDPIPSVFGFHEIWHLFVLAGSSLHYAAIFTLVP